MQEGATPAAPNTTAPNAIDRDSRPTIAPPGEIANPSTANVDPRADKPEPAAGVAYPFVPGSLPADRARPVGVPRTAVPPVIDGQLDDAIWRTAVVLRDFYQTQPGDNTRPSKPTETLLAYDAKNLYIAFRAADDRAGIRATVARRDGIFDDDHIGIFLDTFNDNRRAYFLAFNPLGIQADGIYTEGGRTDFNVDLVFDSKGVVTDDGYTIEVALPFKSLRYEAGKNKLWGVHIHRRIKRLNNELSSWMPGYRDRTGFLNQAGRITDLEGVATERQLEIIPTLTLSETSRRVRTYGSAVSGDPGRLVNSPLALDPGVTAKLGITPTVTLDFTLNPDFAQVEADQTVVTANQRFPIFFPERRPFFLEGIDIFQTRLNVVNTRTIVDPDFAAKLTGKRGRYLFGLLLASDNAPGNYSEDERTGIRQSFETNSFDARSRLLDRNSMVGVLRLKRDVGSNSSVGLLATSYNFVDRRNQVGGFDGRFQVDPKTTFEFQVTGTTSRRYFFNPESDPTYDVNSFDVGDRRRENVFRTGNGFGYTYALDYTGRNFGYFISGVGRTRDYRADVGFVPRTNTNQHRAAVRFSDDPDAKRRIISRRFTNNTSVSFDWQGRTQNWENSSEVILDLQRDSTFGFGIDAGYERLFEGEFGARRGAGRTGAFAGSDPERSTYNGTGFVFADTRPTKRFGGEIVFIYTLNAFDFDFGAGERFPRVSPAALRDPDSPLDPGPGTALRVEAELEFQPVDKLSTSLDYTRSRLVRKDTKLTAFDDNVFSLRATYQFTRFTFFRARLDYSTLSTAFRPQLLLGYAPNPGTSLFVGYNDDLQRNGFNPFVTEGAPVLEPGFRRNGRTFFIKASYLIRRSL